MKLILFFSLSLLYFGGQTQSAKNDHIWPYPQSMTQQDDYVLIHPQEFHFITDSKCDILLEAIKRYEDRLWTQDCARLDPTFKGKIFMEHRLNHVMDSAYKGILKNVTVSFDGDCEKYPQMGANEKYHLTVESSTSGSIHGMTVWAALRGLETFSQLARLVGRDEFLVNLVKIEDFPRFSHRGLLIDSSRHFLPIREIHATLDAMEMNKLNVLHWHIVDDQSFPFVSETFPELSDHGAYNPNTLIYKKEDVEEILDYARKRGIRVVSEFDTPGHTWSWGRGVKGLLTDCYDGSKPNGNQGPIDPTHDENYVFIKKLFTEISNRFPDQYLHLGGDEVPFDCWASNPQIKDFMSKHNMGTDYAKLESYYIQKLVEIVQDLKKSYIVWQEVFDNGVVLKPDTVVHVWISNNYQEELGKVTAKGYHTLLSAPWYLDWISYGSDWLKYYEVEPLNFKGTDAQKALVQGGEACVWAEYVNGANLIPRTWPRASAIAERLWSASSKNSTAEAQPRFHENYCRMMKLGIRVEPQDGPGHCECDYAV